MPAPVIIVTGVSCGIGSEYLLPRPARYVIDKEGIIRAADVNADYTIRPEPSETLEILRTLAT
jgi:peroxiredoxin